MAPSTSPRKVVPLASGEDWPAKTTVSVTRRVFICGVVVEGSDHGKRPPQDVEDLLRSLGTPLTSRASEDVLRSNTESLSNEGTQVDVLLQSERAATDSSALVDVINELVTTERSYVKRLQILKHDYADPLRHFARNKSTAIIPSYEAKILFGNIDNLLPVNEAFLTDLEKMIAPHGSKHIGGVGDVTMKHFKHLRGFEHYKHYYSKREEAQAIYERETRKSSSFSAYIDRIKYSSADIRNRVGLRELLMDPVQRIPRYTLMFRTMIKHMAPNDPQRAKLIEADDIASKIAQAEADEETKRAAIMYCLSATVDGFPANLISNSRRFIDCIDVEDVDVPTPSGGSSSNSSLGVLHCTLFLFDDKLVIVKRPGNGDKPGRILAGLDEIDKVTKAGGLPHGMKKSGMSCKGVVDISDVVVTDVGGSDMHCYFESPPQDQTERWNGRPFRSYSIVHPPSSVNLDPVRTETDKKRFLDNLWNAQARLRTKAGQSVALRDEEREVELKGGRVTVARTYYNVYQRTAFLKEPKKTKIVVHIDALGSADPIPLGIGPPHVAVRIQPMAGELARYTVSSSHINDEAEEDIVQTSRVPAKIVQTIHQFGLFKFRTGRSSMPSTPTASTRSKAAIFGLEAISRNLFNARLGSSKVDIFGGSVNSHRRTKSAGSRSSMYTQTTSTQDGSLAVFSHRSNSTATVATTLSISDDEFFASKSPKGTKRSKSRKSVSEAGVSPTRRLSRVISRSKSANNTDVEKSDSEDESTAMTTHYLDDSERDLARRLDLARRNSESQHNKPVPPLPIEASVESTIYEEEPPNRVRLTSQASRDARSQVSESQKQDLLPPLDHSNLVLSSKRPFGPRCPSPSPSRSPCRSEMPSLAEDRPPEPLLPPMTQTPTTTPRREMETSPLPRSKRQPFVPTGNTETTPKPSSTNNPPPVNSVEPLSIKKKTSVRSSVPVTPSPARKSHTGQSPLSRSSVRISPKRGSSQTKSSRSKPTTQVSAVVVNAERVLHLAQTTKEDVESSHRAVKRIKLEVENARSDCASPSKPVSPSKVQALSPPSTASGTARAAQERMQEMRQVIQLRHGEQSSQGHSRARSMTVTQRDPPVGIRQELLEQLASDADRELMRALASQESLQKEFRQVAAEFKEKMAELEKTKIELQNAKRQCELVKNLLADANTEKDILFEAFNEELDAMYNDANLPEDEAWAAICKDLRETKESRNALTMDISQLKRALAEAEAQKEEWGALLRVHGLIS